MVNTSSGISNTGSITTLYIYNSDHRVISETLPLGNGTTWQYDANGNKIEERRKAQMSDVDSENDLVTRWEYDLTTDLLLSKTMTNGLVLHYSYDAHRNLTTTTISGTGTLATREIRSEYDAL